MLRSARAFIAVGEGIFRKLEQFRTFKGVAVRLTVASVEVDGGTDCGTREHKLRLAGATIAVRGGNFCERSTEDLKVFLRLNVLNIVKLLKLFPTCNSATANPSAFRESCCA